MSKYSIASTACRIFSTETLMQLKRGRLCSLREYHSSAFQSLGLGYPGKSKMASNVRGRYASHSLIKCCSSRHWSAVLFPPNAHWRVCTQIHTTRLHQSVSFLGSAGELKGQTSKLARMLHCSTKA